MIYTLGNSAFPLTRYGNLTMQNQGLLSFSILLVLLPRTLSRSPQLLLTPTPT